MQDFVDRWIAQCRKKHIFWTHEGAPEYPHAVLPDGTHTDSLYDIDRVSEDPVLLHSGATALFKLLQSEGVDPASVDRTLGVGKGSAGLAHTMAHILTYNRPSEVKTHCLSAYVERTPRTVERRNGGGETRVLEGERALVVTNSFSPHEVRFGVETVTTAGASPVRRVVSLANFSGMKEIGQYPVLSLIFREPRRWSALRCDLCQQGSPTVSVADPDLWNLLTGKGTVKTGQ